MTLTGKKAVSVLYLDLDGTPNLQEALRSYTTLFDDYRARRGHEFFAIGYRDGYHGH